MWPNRQWKMYSFVGIVLIHCPARGEDEKSQESDHPDVVIMKVITTDHEPITAGTFDTDVPCHVGEIILYLHIPCIRINREQRSKCKRN